MLYAMCYYGRMTLMAHAAAGGAVTLLFRAEPAAGLVAAFFSHFLLDMVPHWHYALPSLKRAAQNQVGGKFIPGRAFATDILKTGADCGIGFALTLAFTVFFFPGWELFALQGAALGVLPDFLQLLYYLFKGPFLTRLQEFHVAVHTLRRLDAFPIRGLTIEAAAVLLSFALVLLF